MENIEQAVSEVAASVDNYAAKTADVLKQCSETLSGVKSDVSEQGERISKLEGRAPGIILPGTASRKYSVGNLVAKMAGDKKVDAGYEIEQSQELAQKSGLSMGNAMLIPLSTKTIDYATEGTDLVPTAQGDLIDVLRAQSVVMKTKATQLMGLEGNVQLPRKTAGSTAYWVDGDASAISASTPTFDNVSLTPKYLGALVTYTYRMSHQSSPAMEELLRRDLMDSLATELDRVALIGSGSGSEPSGIYTTTNVNITNWDANSPSSEAIEYADLVGAQERLAEDDVDISDLEYVVDASLLADLKSIDKGTDTGQYLMQDGRIDGYKTHVTSALPTQTVICGDFKELLIATWGAVAIELDHFTGFSSGNVSIRAILPCDIGVRHPESFEVLQQ